jgi:hypothetical protein
MKLVRTKQCKRCPWKVSTNPFDIPDGYCPIKHRNLASTIATPGDLRISGSAMACHHSNGSDQMYCVGWLHNQLGIGNNIGLRLMMRNCENIGQLKVVGKQHQRFEDTLPE